MKLVLIYFAGFPVNTGRLLYHQSSFSSNNPERVKSESNGEGRKPRKGWRRSRTDTQNTQSQTDETSTSKPKLQDAQQGWFKDKHQFEPQERKKESKLATGVGEDRGSDDGSRSLNDEERPLHPTFFKPIQHDKGMLHDENWISI